jgi:WD40 repeat protein
MIWVMALTPDGNYAILGSGSTLLGMSTNALCRMDLRTGHISHPIKGFKSAVNAIAFTPDGRYFLSNSHDQTLRLWELSSGRLLRVLKGQSGNINTVVVAPNGRHAVSGSANNIITLWELMSGRCLRTIRGHGQAVDDMAITPDGNYLVSGSMDGSVRLWELSSGRCLFILEGHKHAVNAVAITPDGHHVLSGGGDSSYGSKDNASRDNELRLWELVWDYEFPEPVDWDEGARPYLENFLTICNPHGKNLFKKDRPSYTEADFQKLLVELGYRGYGWLRPEGVRAELEKIAGEWQGPPSFGK